MKKSISGIRGIVGEDLQLRDIIKFCNGFSHIIESKKCVIARDTRVSGSMFKETACAALMQNGIDVLDLGTAATPVAFYEARKFGAGVMITASHNPLEWNGLKFIINGRGINEKELGAVLADQGSHTGKIGAEKTTSSDYIEMAQKLVGGIKNPPKVIVDVGGGAASNVAPDLLKKLGCSVEVINKPGESARGPDPTADDLTGLIQSCSDADIGFAFDLDGDRLVVVKNGKKQAPDATLGLGIAKALKLGYKKFVLSIDTSIAVEKFIAQSGGTSQRSKVGEANVIQMMQENGAQAGGEGSSAGFILPEFNFCRDGILTSGLIASILESSEFDEVLSFMNRYSQKRAKVAADSKLHDITIKTATKKFKERYEITELDGTRGMIDDETWFLVRKSNTEDVIRISAESDGPQKAQDALDYAKKIVVESYEECK